MVQIYSLLVSATNSVDFCACEGGARDKVYIVMELMRGGA